MPRAPGPRGCRNGRQHLPEEKGTGSVGQVWGLLAGPVFLITPCPRLPPKSEARAGIISNSPVWRRGHLRPCPFWQLQQNTVDWGLTQIVGFFLPFWRLGVPDGGAGVPVPGKGPLADGRLRAGSSQWGGSQSSGLSLKDTDPVVRTPLLHPLDAARRERQPEAAAPLGGQASEAAGSQDITYSQLTRSTPIRGMAETPSAVPRET